MFERLFLFNKCEGLGCIVCIAECAVERNVLLYIKEVNGTLERTALLALAIFNCEKLLNIVKSKRSVHKRLEAKENHVALKFRQIKRTPGSENIIFSAPLKEAFHNFFKRLLMFKLRHLNMNKLTCHVVHGLVNLRFDKSAKLVNHNFV